MSIPESQLEIWSKLGAVTTAKATHESIRKALNANTSPLKQKGFLESSDFEVYLQGSYKNTTNIRGDSDVDVVVQLNQVFNSDTSQVPLFEQILYQQSFQDSIYHWEDWRFDVLTALRAYYGGNNIDDTGNNSLKLKKGSGRLAADIIPCLQYRRYHRFRNISESFIEGIVFYPQKECRAVINYPKLHYKNGILKNSSYHTNGWYKPIIRIFKNAKSYLVEQGLVTKDLAPSYFLECLLYNVHDDKFVKSYQLSYLEIVCWLTGQMQTEAAYSWVCQNEQILLFGDTPEQWSVQNAWELVNQLISLWLEW